MEKTFFIRMLKVQIVIAAITAVIFAFQNHLLDSVYGIFLSLVNTAALISTFRVSDKISELDPSRGIAVLYISAVIRFIFLAIFFVIGLFWLKLYPVAVVLTFVVMQIGQVYSLQGKKRLTD